MVAVPQFIAALGATAGGAAAAAGTVAIASTASALSIAVGYLTVGFVTAYSMKQSKLRNSGEGGTAAAQQILVKSTTEPRKIVYGEALVSGPLVFMNTNGDSPLPNGALYALVALTGHEIDSFQGFYLDDKLVDIADVDTAGDGDVTGAPYAPLGSDAVLYLRGHTGTAGQTVDTMVDSGFAIWTSDHRGRGVAYFVARMDQVSEDEEDTTWERGAPANLAAVIRGKKVYDPRLDSTFTGTWGTGSGTHRVNTPSTWAWSDNPALCLADYLIDDDLGAGEDFEPEFIDYNSVALAADDCDELVAIPTAATEKRFTCNGVLSCLDDHRENIEKILSSMAGTLRYYNGLWRISAGMWPASSSFALTESDLVGPITYQPEPDRTERFNAVRGVYFDPSRSYKEVAFLPVEDTALQAARDDGLVIWKDLDLPMTNSETMAQRLAFRALAQASRTGVSVFPMGYRGMDIAPGDRGTDTIAELAWSAKDFRCIGVRHVDMVGAEIVLKEDDSAAYDDPAEGDYGTRSGATVVTFPRFIRNSTTVLVEDASDDDLALLFSGSYGTVCSASIVVPASQTRKLSVEFSAYALIGAAVGNPAGAFRITENGTPVQEIKGFNTDDAAQNMTFEWTHVVEMTAGTHTFEIEGRATSGTATKTHAVIKITVLKQG